MFRDIISEFYGSSPGSTKDFVILIYRKALLLVNLDFLVEVTITNSGQFIEQ